MALPDLTPQQRAQALEKATRARRRRAEVKDALKSRKITLSEVIDMAATDDAIAKMKVRSLLEALPRVGSIDERDQDRAFKACSRSWSGAARRVNSSLRLNFSASCGSIQACLHLRLLSLQVPQLLVREL